MFYAFNAYLIDIFQEFLIAYRIQSLSATLATDQKLPLSCRHISYQSLIEGHLP